MVLNPWEVHSIDDFNYFCCPECVFRSKEDISFQAHALQNHELSKTFFNNVELGNLLRGIENCLGEVDVHTSFKKGTWKTLCLHKIQNFVSL